MSDVEHVVTAFGETIVETQMATFLFGRIDEAHRTRIRPEARKRRDSPGNVAWFVADPRRPGEYQQIAEPVSEHG